MARTKARGCLLACLLAGSLTIAAAEPVKLIIVDPGHFHAALIEKDMYPQVSPKVTVYSPLGPDLLDYLNRVALFNGRMENPTHWELDIHTGGDFFGRMLDDHAGNAVVFAGRNREKIGRILRSLQAGYNVLADKPWIIDPADLPKLAEALDLAKKRGLVAYDIMTERYEITSILQKQLVAAPDVFGQLVKGSAEGPAIRARSIHYLKKVVAGVPLQRPVWFFDIHEAGEGMADVGTHVVDLIDWIAFPRQTIDYRSDIQMVKARRWPNVIDRQQFAQVTGATSFPAELAQWVKDGKLEYYSNHEAQYVECGVNVAIDIRWKWEAPAGSGDLYEASFGGSRARVEIRQPEEPNSRPELYVVPNTAELRDEVFAALRRQVAGWQKDRPGIGVSIRNGEAHIEIPDRYRVGHESHFAQVTRAFLGYLADPKSIPEWEQSNMLAKYFITTKGVEMSRH
jgi:predicted dehydrogenase